MSNENNQNKQIELTDKKIMPGTSQPQDLGTISYKDMTDTSAVSYTHLTLPTNREV